MLSTCYHRSEAAPELLYFLLDINFMMIVKIHVVLVIIVRYMMMLFLFFSWITGLFLLLRSFLMCTLGSCNIFVMSSLGSATIFRSGFRSLRINRTSFIVFQLSIFSIALGSHHMLSSLIDVDSLLLLEWPIKVIISMSFILFSLFEPLSEKLQLCFKSIRF
jgi:hypothetical protein